MSENKPINILLSLSMVKEIWEAFSDKPIVLGIFEMLDLNSSTGIYAFLAKYWLLIVSVLILIWINAPSLWRKIKGLEVVENRHFANQAVLLDGHHYINCIFENCTLVHNGGETKITNATKRGGFKIQLGNPSAVKSMMVYDALGLIVKNEHVKSMVTTQDHLEHGFPKSE